VMLDHDLAEIYEVPTKALKQAVRRNMDRFPDDFMFELTMLEYNALKSRLRSQFVTLEIEDGRGKYPKYPPFAFTEHGVAMLSSVLSSEKAIQASISIIRAFITTRELAAHAMDVKQLSQDNADTRRLLKEFMEETEGKFDDVYVALAKLATQRQSLDKDRRLIGFKRN